VEIQDEIIQDGYDFIMGNVPFGLGLNAEDKRRSEVVFLERCINLAKFRVGIIVPDGLLSCTRDKPIRQWILANFGSRNDFNLKWEKQNFRK
jgi:hypothetical protein